MAGISGKIIGLALGAFFIAYVFVTALSAVITANTSGYSTAQLALFGVIAISLIVAIVVMVLKEAGIKV